MKKGLKFPEYDAGTDGNVFDWLLSTADEFRKVRQRERYVEMERQALRRREDQRAENHK